MVDDMLLFFSRNDDKLDALIQTRLQSNMYEYVPVRPMDMAIKDTTKKKNDAYEEIQKYQNVEHKDNRPGHAAKVDKKDNAKEDTQSGSASEICRLTSSNALEEKSNETEEVSCSTDIDHLQCKESQPDSSTEVEHMDSNNNTSKSKEENGEAKQTTSDAREDFSETAQSSGSIKNGSYEHQENDDADKPDQSAGEEAASTSTTVFTQKN